MMMYLCENKRLLINEILKFGLSESFYGIELDTDYGLSMTIKNRGIPHGSKGLYAIYARDEDGRSECLYVGESNCCVNQRVRRFFKELSYNSRYDESHAGARRAREWGYTIDSHTYYVKYVPWRVLYRIEERLNIQTDWNNLDEHIAQHLKSKFNSSTVLEYGYKGRTLQEFLEIA